MQLLIVNDHPIPQKLIERACAELSATATWVADGHQAWEHLVTHHYDMVLCPQSADGIDGIELFRRIRLAEFKYYVYLILFTSSENGGEAAKLEEEAADDLIPAGIGFDELSARLRLGIRSLHQARELNRIQQQIQDNYHQSVDAMAQMIAVYAPELGEHCRRTAQNAVRLAEKHPQVSSQDYDRIEAAARIHDLGMIGLPVSLLNKRRTEMTGDELELFRNHPALGASIVDKMELLKPLGQLIRCHHEQVNGCGFPQNMEQDQIPVAAQIISAASIYDNLVHKGDVALGKVPEALQRFRDYQLSFEMVELLVSLNKEKIQEDRAKTTRVCPVDQLAPGMALAAHVRTRTGTLILPEKTILDPHSIEKLQNHAKIGAVHRNIEILKRSMRG